MNTDDRSPRRRRRLARWAGGAVLAAAVLAACSSGGDAPADALSGEPRGASSGPLPTFVGGVELAELDPATLLVGTDLAYGTALPSRQAAAAAYTEAPEVGTSAVRAVYEARTGRRLAEVLVLSLVGSEIFDEDALAAFERGLVAGLAGSAGSELSIAGRPVRRATGSGRTVVSHREGNLLVVVDAPIDGDAVLVATRQIEARSRGEVGSPALATPLLPLPAEAVFVPEPTIAFTPFAPPEDEPVPEAPSLQGVTAVQGRYGVVAGERRSTVWSLAVDPAAYGTAEALGLAMRDLAAARAGGVEPQPVEVIDRVVLKALAAAGDRSAMVFRHQSLVLLVEGEDPAQLDAVVTAWITALGDQGP